MSEETVEVVREWIDAYNQGGLEESIRFLDPEIEWATTEAYLEAGTYQGHEGIRQWIGRAGAAWEDVELEPEGFVDAAEQVVVTVRVKARGTQTGASGAFTLTVVAEVQLGLIVRIRNFTNEAEALEAAGLGESRRMF